MNKKLSRILAGTLSAMFIGQVLIYGDGSSQGIAHAETIEAIKEAVAEEKTHDELAEEFDSAVEGIGEVEYFDESEPAAQSEEEFEEPDYMTYLEISGRVSKGGQKTNDKTPIYVRIFDGNWAEINSVEIADGGEFEVQADGSDVYHVKFECDGYLPFYLKDFGTGSYTVGSGDSWDTVTLVPGDTTWNEENDNQWSDDVLNAADAAYIRSCLGATRGDSDFNPSMDADGDNVISQADLDAFCAFYDELGDTEYILPQYICDMDMNGDGVLNEFDYEIFISNDVTEEEYNNFVSELDGIYQPDTWAYIYNHEMTGDIYVNADDYEQGLAKINASAQKRGRSENYYEYMDKDDNGTIEASDVKWFEDAYNGDLDWDHAFKRNIRVYGNGEFPYSLNLHDTNLDLNGWAIKVNDCMSFTTDMPQFWGDSGAALDINGGLLDVWNNLVFRTAAQNSGAGQNMYLHGGAAIIGGDFNFGQIGCYDTI